MKKPFALLAVGFVLGAVFTYFALNVAERLRNRRPSVESGSICYSCFWQGYDPKLRTDLVEFYRQFETPDAMVAGDAQYILWRATGTPNCDAREFYRRVAENDRDGHRRFLARTILGFSASECRQRGENDLKAASKLAQELGLSSQAALLGQIASGSFSPRFSKVPIDTSLTVPAGSNYFVLGESSIEVPSGLKVGAQVDRTARDWISYQMRWDLTENPVSVFTVLNYHEGAVLKRLMSLATVEAYPLAGAIVAQAGDKWIAPDETGVFRFEVLPDKLMYPTTHAFGQFAWIEDTHGISALVPQALERQYPLVIGCGDSEGKMEAAFYLAQKGVNVVFPGDRYQDLLIGYQAKGTLLGTAPVKKVGNKVVIGDQPVRFALKELITVQDTKELFPIQYYDAAARYFRRLAQLAPVTVQYVEVKEPNQIGLVLAKARETGSTAVAVRIATRPEYQALREWLAQSIKNRAVLFHSGLYPHAQELFELYPEQVTFGDLHPTFSK